MDIIDIVNIMDIVDHCGYYRLDIMNVVVETGKRIKGVIRVSYNSTPLLNSSFCEMELW
jgi:hypothetical protein